MKKAISPKLDSAQNLDQFSRILSKQLDYFVVWSSVVSAMGNAGQTNYGYANSGLDAICEARNLDNLPGVSIQWGIIGDVGMLSGQNSMRIHGTFKPQRISNCLQSLEKILLNPKPIVTSYITTDNSIQTSEKSAPTDILSTVLNILGFKPTQQVDLNAPLETFGADSLMVVELKKVLERDFNIILPLYQIRGVTLNQLKTIASTPNTTKAPDATPVGPENTVIEQKHSPKPITQPIFTAKINTSILKEAFLK